MILPPSRKREKMRFAKVGAKRKFLLRKMPSEDPRKIPLFLPYKMNCFLKRTSKVLRGEARKKVLMNGFFRDDPLMKIALNFNW